MWIWAWTLLITVAAAVDCSIFLNSSPRPSQALDLDVKKNLETFRTAIAGAKKIPDPLKIYSVNEWYILDAIAEPLIRFDSVAGKYNPSLAESWQFGDGGIRIKLKSGLRFHDGTSLTIEDVLATFRRIVRLRTSTHYQIWEHLPACTPTSCDAIRAEGDSLIFDYKGSRESLFMFLSCPESSIWSKEDVESQNFKPKRFSGFYYPESVSDEGLKLSKNAHNSRSSSFPNAPIKIEVSDLPLAQSLSDFASSRLDALLVAHTPMKTLPFDLAEYQVHRTVPLSLNYLLKLNPKLGTPFNREFLEAVWSNNDGDKMAVPAFGILPPGVEGGLTKQESLQSLESRPPSATVKIGVFVPFHSNEFADYLVRAGMLANIKIEIMAIDRETFFDAISNPERAKFDYLLSAYVASDKFPMTQLKLVANHHELSMRELENVSSSEKLKHLKDVQTFLISRQLVIPLFYMPEVILAQKHVILGNQPTTDSDLQLWRVNEVSKP